MLDRKSSLVWLTLIPAVSWCGDKRGLFVHRLLLLFMSIYAALGVYLFENVKYGKGVSNHANFETWQRAVRCPTDRLDQFPNPTHIGSCVPDYHIVADEYWRSVEPHFARLHERRMCRSYRAGWLRCAAASAAANLPIRNAMMRCD